MATRKQKHLIKSASSKAVGKNIAYEMKKHPKQSQAQNIAIALSVQRAAKKKMRGK